MTDLISRRAAIKAIDDLPNCYNGYSDTYDKACIIGVLEELPPAEQKKGKWVDVMTEEWCTFDECKCSVCGVVEYFNKGWKKFSYCPNCGARMESE